MKSEIRFIIYTNDPFILAIASFPLSIINWEILSQSQRSIYILFEDDEVIITTKIVDGIRSNPNRTEKTSSIDERLFTMRPGFTPKINNMTCIDDEVRVLEFKRITLHPNFTIDPSHPEVIYSIEKIWNSRYSYINDLITEIPKAKAFLPKHKSKSFLQLEKVDDDSDKAQNIEILWDIWNQIITGGNDYAKTPICDVVERTQVSLRQWEYRPYKKSSEIT